MRPAGTHPQDPAVARNDRGPTLKQRALRAIACVVISAELTATAAVGEEGSVLQTPSPGGSRPLPARTAATDESVSSGVDSRPVVRTWQRSIYMRRYRFRRKREFWGKGEVAANVTVRPIGTTPSSAQVKKVPSDKEFQKGVRRSKRTKKCNNSNDDSCGTLNSPAACRWTAAGWGPYTIYTDWAEEGEFCTPVDVRAEFFELDKDKAEIVRAFASNVDSLTSCLSLLFDAGDDSGSTTVSQWLDCGVTALTTIADIADSIKSIPFDVPQDLGQFFTESITGGTPPLPTPAQTTSPNADCEWDDPNFTWHGDIANTPAGKTAQVEFVVQVEKLGCSQAAGLSLTTCGCDEAGGLLPMTVLDLARFEFHQKSGCEIRCRIQTLNTDLRDAAAFVGTRRFETYFDTDNDTGTGANAYPGCGAEYYVEIVLVSDGTTLTAHRAKYAWSGGWQATVDQDGVYDATLEPCKCTFTVSFPDIGNPVSDIAAWTITRDGSFTILDELPSGVCTNRIPIPLVADDVCPHVLAVDTQDVEAGLALAPIEVLFDEPVLPPVGSDLTITPPVPGIVLGLNWNERLLSITPQLGWLPGRYVATLNQSITDCSGNALAGDPDVCGSPFVFEFCVPNLGLQTRDGSGNLKKVFALNESVYVTGTGQTGLPPTVAAYVMDADVLGRVGDPLIDQTTDGITAVAVTGGNIGLTNLGACRRPGEYALILDADGDGFYDESDVTINPCYDGFIVDPCDDLLMDGPLALWPLDETYPNAGSIDVGEGGFHGTHVGLPAAVPGQVAGALSFTGTEYVEVPNDPELEMETDDFSVSGWINPTTTSGIRSVLDMRSATRGYHVALVNGLLVMQLQDASGFTNYTSNAAVSSGVWTHFVCSIDRSQPNALAIYLNGALDSTHDGTIRSGDLTSGAPLWIGGHQHLPSSHFDGAIDELGLWDDPLMQWEAQALYDSGRDHRSCPDMMTVGAPEDPVSENDVVRHRLLGVVQNPFPASGLIHYVLPGDAPVRLSIYDSQGRRIAILAEGVRPAGLHTIEWAGRDASGAAVASGVYFVRIEAMQRSETKKLVLVR